MHDLHHDNPNERASARSFFTELTTNRAVGVFCRATTYSLVWIPTILIFFSRGGLRSEALTVGAIQSLLNPVLAFGIMVGFGAAIVHCLNASLSRDSR
jgi:hypothetical protein